MHTVESILKDVYGKDSEAARAFDVVPSAVWNWKSWGYFPTRLLPKILSDAEAKGIPLTLSEVPITPSDRVENAA